MEILMQTYKFKGITPQIKYIFGLNKIFILKDISLFYLNLQIVDVDGIEISNYIH